VTITNKTQDEPVLTAAVIQSFVAAVIALVVSFGLALTTNQIGAITTIVALVAPFVAAFWARRRVSPVR
jgi:hypothetical protein